jgi:hypothetical protein
LGRLYNQPERLRRQFDCVQQVLSASLSKIND